LAGPDQAEALWEAEYQQHLVHRGLELIQAEFQPATWQAFCDCVLGGRAVADVAREQGTSTNAVYLAKSRVLRRLRQGPDGLMDLRNGSWRAERSRTQPVMGR